MSHLFGNISLRLFAQGEDGAAAAPDAAANAVSTVEAADDDGRLSKLRALGVPEAKLTKRANIQRNTPRTAQTAASVMQKVQTAPKAVQRVQNAASTAPGEQTTQQVAAAETNAEEEKPGRMSWEDIMADPIYNKRMQQTLQSRLRSAKDAEQTLQRLAPAMELLSQKYGLRSTDAEALVNAIRAENAGKPADAASGAVNADAADSTDTAASGIKPAQPQPDTGEAAIQQHLQRLKEQGESLKRSFPAFDLRAELKNPAFLRMTSPAVGLSVEDAYFACHRRELQAAAMQAAAERTAQQLAASLRAVQARPQENGGQAPSVTHFNYASASREQREALKKSIRTASARGEKLYPGSE